MGAQLYAGSDDWLHTASAEVQRSIGVIEFQEDELGAFSTARNLIARLPEPRTPVEERLLRGLLVELSVWWADRAHRRAHGGAVGSCSFRADAQVHDAWRMRDGRPSPSRRVFAEWADQYFRALRRAHPAPVEEAARWIREHSRERVTLRLAARAVGVHPVVLRRDFQVCVRLSPHAYLQRVRLADTVHLLASGSHDVRSALYTAGWSSPKSLYRAARKASGTSLRALRALPREALDRALELPTCVHAH
ncbi:MAG TPA: AraC family transcriptional regulator [Vicinamibacterales bacterium]